MTITLKRTGNHIALLTDSWAEVATLYDGDERLITDNFADTRLMLDRVDVAVALDAMGLDAQTVRLIDALPVLDRKLQG